MQTYDALMIPQGLRAGRTFKERLFNILDVAEPLLGVDRAAGGRAYLRPPVPGSAELMFCSPSPDDTINFPIRHPRSGQPRYRWEPGPEGIRLGYLKTDQELDLSAAQSEAQAQAARRAELEAENRRLVDERGRLRRYLELVRRGCGRDLADPDFDEFLELRDEFDPTPDDDFEDWPDDAED